MTDQELKDLVASLAVESRKTDLLFKETDKIVKENAILLKENDRLLKESREEHNRKVQENDRLLKESGDKNDREIQKINLILADASKMVQEASETVKHLSKEMGGLSDNVGFHAEQYFQEILAKKLSFGRIKYDRMIPNLTCWDKNGIPLIEFDIVLMNGKSVAIIETKSRIHPKFVKTFVEKKLPKFREFFPEFSKSKTYLGIASFSFSQKVLEEAQKYGIGIIRQVGDSVEIDANNLKVY